MPKLLNYPKAQLQLILLCMAMGQGTACSLVSVESCQTEPSLVLNSSCTNLVSKGTSWASNLITQIKRDPRLTQLDFRS